MMQFQIPKKIRNKSLTLLELSIAICIFSLIVLALSNIDTFGRMHVVNTDRRIRLQQDASYVLQHISRTLNGTGSCGGAIGDINNVPIDVTTTIGGDKALIINVDYNNNGKWEGSSVDRQVAYRYNASTYQFWYYPPYSGGTPGSYTAICFSRIRGDFSATTSQPTYRTYSSGDNFVEVQIGACWNPASDGTCGTPDNPALKVKSRIYMPSVTTH
jgi:hypothetical protein